MSKVDFLSFFNDNDKEQMKVRLSTLIERAEKSGSVIFTGDDIPLEELKKINWEQSTNIVFKQGNNLSTYRNPNKVESLFLDTIFNPKTDVRIAVLSK